MRFALNMIILLVGVLTLFYVLFFAQVWNRQTFDGYLLLSTGVICTICGILMFRVHKENPR